MFYKYYFYNLSKKLRIGLSVHAGRNFSGRICVHHRRGGVKRNYIYVDFFRRLNCLGRVCKIIKIPLFSSFLAGILYDNGLFSFIISTDNLRQGNIIFSGSFLKNKDNINLGSSLSLYNLDLFSLISNVELKPFKGSTLIRSAGNSAILISKVDNKFFLKLRSGWLLILNSNCMCTLGINSNINNNILNLKKAGVSFYLGKRPVVRGVAMNPCDHPHGGGEGRKSPLASPKSPWGWLTKNTPSKIKKYEIRNKKKFKKYR